MATIESTMAKLHTELKAIKLQTKEIRIEHCVKYFVIWRKAGYSPHEMQLRYQLSTHDMYGTILDCVHRDTGIDRDELLKCPGRGRGQHDSFTRPVRLKEELSEAQQIIEICESLTEQANVLLQIISEMSEIS